MQRKRVAWKEDALVSLRLRDDLFTIGQMLKSPYMRFFDVRSRDGQWRDLDLDRVSVLFCVLVGQVVVRKLVVGKVSSRSVVSSHAPVPKLWIRARLSFAGGFPFRGGDLVEVDPDLGTAHAEVVKADLSMSRDRDTIEKLELTNMWGAQDLAARLVEYFDTGRNHDPTKEKVFGADE